MIEVVYAEEFLKDLRKLKGTSYCASIKTLCFDLIPSCKSINEIASIKKLKGHDDYYRIRKGDFRIGIKINGSSITFLRCLPERIFINTFRSDFEQSKH